MRLLRPLAGATAICIALALSPALAAQTPNAARDSADVQRLGELASVLGQSHALHRVCAGPEDGFWYELMQRLIQTEHPDTPTRRQLIDRFNQGFAERQTQYPDCTEASRAAASEAARQGQALISALRKTETGAQH